MPMKLIQFVHKIISLPHKIIRSLNIVATEARPCRPMSETSTDIHGTHPFDVRCFVIRRRIFASLP